MGQSVASSPQVHRSTGPRSPIITSMVNCSLTLGYFPVAWKAALVDPRLKKRSQSASLSNLRPVRNLQFISKLTEDLWTCESVDPWTCGPVDFVDLWTLWTCGLYGPVDSVDLCT